MQQFSQEQIDILKAEYGTIKTIDPCSPVYTRLIKFLDSMPQPMLKQLSTEKIPFVSMLAKNRCK